MSFHRVLGLILTLFVCGAQAQDERTAEVLRRAQEAAGGIEALSAIKDMIITRNVDAVAGGMSGQQVVKVLLPSAFRQESSLPFGSFALSLVDGQGTMQSPQGKKALAGPQLAQAQGELLRVRERLLLADQDPTLELTYKDAVDDNGRQADTIEVSDSESDLSVLLFVDRETGELYKTAYDAVALVGSQRLEEVYSDFREVNGVRTPFAIEVRSSGELITRIAIDKVLHNTGLTKAEMR